MLSDYLLWAYFKDLKKPLLSWKEVIMQNKVILTGFIYVSVCVGLLLHKEEISIYPHSHACRQNFLLFKVSFLPCFPHCPLPSPSILPGHQSSAQTVAGFHPRHTKHKGHKPNSPSVTRIQPLMSEDLHKCKPIIDVGCPYGPDFGRWTEQDWKVVFIYLRKLEFMSILEKVWEKFCSPKS